ncbi:hypothetical protein JCM33374_g6599 [Metschnikowia sp. JCM 33374]|nr:hypothetical protein JCM33374_g6599 [Metschnikowia sp. JCM 33374]
MGIGCHNDRSVTEEAIKMILKAGIDTTPNCTADWPTMAVHSVTILWVDKEFYVTANHTDIAITKTGDLVLSVQGITITIREALYSPDLDGNFISTFDIAKAGYEVSHDTEELWIRFKDLKEIHDWKITG